MSDQTPHAVAYKLAQSLLLADGKGMYSKGHSDAATREEIATAIEQSVTLLKINWNQS